MILTQGIAMFHKTQTHLNLYTTMYVFLTSPMYLLYLISHRQKPNSQCFGNMLAAGQSMIYWRLISRTAQVNGRRDSWRSYWRKSWPREQIKEIKKGNHLTNLPQTCISLVGVTLSQWNCYYLCHAQLESSFSKNSQMIRFGIFKLCNCCNVNLHCNETNFTKLNQLRTIKQYDLVFLWYNLN